MAPADVVSHRPLWRPVRAAGVAVAFAALMALFAPERLSIGWHALLDRSSGPGRFGGADSSPVPLVGDLEVTLHYPAYTGRQTAVLSNASGELRVVPGTRVRLDTTALEPAGAAWIAFDDEGEKLLPLQISLGQLSGEFDVRTPVKYRFLLRAPDGHRRVEAVPRTIEIEPDNEPRVELHAPAEELDVTGLKRVELAYVAEDDYGITRADLVWDGPDGKPRRMPIEVPGVEAGAAGAAQRAEQALLGPGRRAAPARRAHRLPHRGVRQRRGQRATRPASPRRSRCACSARASATSGSSSSSASCSRT